MENLFFTKFKERAFRYSTKYANSPRKFIFKLSFWLLRNLFRVDATNKKTLDPIGNLKIAVITTGGVGDIMINALYVQQLSKYVNVKSQIDIYAHHKDIISGIFYNKDFVANTYSIRLKQPLPSEYDMIIEISRSPLITWVSARASSGKMGAEIANYAGVIGEFSRAHPAFFQSGELFDFIGEEYHLLMGDTRWTQADIGGLLNLKNASYALEYDSSAEDFLRKNKLTPKRYITLQRGSKTGNLDTKLWSLQSYSKLVELLKSRFADITIVQIGRDSTFHIDSVDVDFRGKTNFEELKAILKNSLLHIDCECGMVHMTHNLGGKSAVFFGPTAIEFYGYPENVNISSNVCRHCEWLVQNWGDKCLRDPKVSKCMETITPQFAFEKIAPALELLLK